MMISDTALVLFKDRMVQTNCLPAGPASDSESPPSVNPRALLHACIMFYARESEVMKQ